MRPCLKRDEVSARTSQTECRGHTPGHGLVMGGKGGLRDRWGEEAGQEMGYEIQFAMGV